MTITLPPEIEAQLKDRARQRGMDAPQYVRKLIDDALVAPDRATLDLLAKWDEEDATDDPAEIERRKAQWEEFKRSMNEHSLSDRPVYP